MSHHRTGERPRLHPFIPEVQGGGPLTFVASVRNRHTREAYARAASRFLGWCEQRDVLLSDLTPLLFSTYVNDLCRALSPGSVKLHLSALRRFLDWQVADHVLAANPADGVRAPAVRRFACTSPVLRPDEGRSLLERIDTTTLVGLRDRAILATMMFGFAKVGAVVALDVGDCFAQGGRLWLRLSQSSNGSRSIPAHPRLAEFLNSYLDAAQLRGQRSGPLFRSTRGGPDRLTSRRLSARDILAMTKRRCEAAGLARGVCNHSLRATGIAAYLGSGGSIETAALIAGHASTATTQVYDPRLDRSGPDELDRIPI